MSKTLGRACFAHSTLLRVPRVANSTSTPICPRSALPSSNEHNDESPETPESLVNSIKNLSPSSFPSLPDLTSFYQHFPDSKQKAQQLMNQMNELWKLANNSNTSPDTQSTITSVNDMLFQLLEQTMVFPQESPVSIPSTPPFDPILSLQLAAHAFRAYLEPPEAVYREIAVSSLPNAPEENVYNHLAFADTSVITPCATGLFMIKLTGTVEDAYLTATINKAISLNLLHQKHITILRHIHNRHHDSEEPLDVLTLDLYHSKDDYASLAEPALSTSVDLGDIVHRALNTGEQAHANFQELSFDSPSQGKRRRKGLQFPWPSDFGLELPFFPFSKDKVAQSGHSDEQAHKKISIQVTFVPFDEKVWKKPPNTSLASADDEADAPKNELARKALQAFQTAFQKVSRQNVEEQENLTDTDRSVRDFVKEFLRVKLPEGAMPTPTDWNRFILATTSLYKIAEASLQVESTSTLKEQLSETLFMESVSTDTQIWLYRDSVKKNLVVSFRGTEQVKWRDFFTDAQTFLQRWVPGEDIDLTIKTSNTVGLNSFVPSIISTSEEDDTVPDDAIAVHYGFLRAYASVQTVLLQYISELTSNLEEDYSIYFTGHSLGGALAIMAAVDFVARRGWEKVCCMSYGSPKVGNINFAKRFNELVPNSFRIVNDEDLITRMPRSVTEESNVGKYRHSGRTVLLNSAGDYWIEGRTGSPYKDGKSVFDVLHERCGNLSDLLKMEQQLWDNLLSGKSVKHHLECSYFAAMHQIVRRYIKESKS